MKHIGRYLLSLIGLVFSVLLSAQTVSHWANGELRKHVMLLTEETPFALKAYDFAERYLDRLYKMSNKDRIIQLDVDGVTILEGSIERIKLINARTSLGFYEKDNYYIVSLANDNFPVIKIKFPASCQLMLGKNLKQLESQFIEDLKKASCHVVAPEKVDKNTLKHIKGNYYVSKGTYYYAEEINDNIFYEEKKKGQLTPFLSTLHPEESINNLFLSETLQQGKDILITVRKYGLGKEMIKIPLNVFTQYLKNNGCKIYIGVERLSTHSVNIIMFAVNEVLKYNHVMNVEVPYAFLSQSSFVVEGDINLFIPTHNIASIFGELNLIEKPFKSKIQVK